VGGVVSKYRVQPRGWYKTVAGFLMTELGCIPNEGEQLSMFGYNFMVLTKDRLRIVDVRITKNSVMDDVEVLIQFI
jgi:CBS domain containing-hemolysin-like protein